MIMHAQIKDFLSVEDKRNRTHAALFARMLRLAYGRDVDVIVGHHVTFEFHGDISTENEIPSADCLLFDHDIMPRIFGRRRAMELMQHLATIPAEERCDAVEKE